MKVEVDRSEYLKPKFMEERGITVVTILGEGEISTFNDEKTHEVKHRNTVPIDFAGRQDGDPDKWTLNNKAAKIMTKIFGDDTKSWIGHKIELLVIKDKYTYITVDELRTTQHKAQQQSTV